MYRISYIKIVLVSVFVFIAVSIGYAGWKSLRSSKERNIQYSSPQLSTADTRKTRTDDISGWKTFRYDDYALEVKYPSYYYAIPTTKSAPLWGIQKTPVFSLILSEVSPGGGVKDTVYPNMGIDVFRQST